MDELGKWLAGVLIAGGGLWVAVMNRVDARLSVYVRKDVNDARLEALTEKIDELIEANKTTQAIVRAEMPAAVEKACITGVNAGAAMVEKRLSARVIDGKVH